MDVLIKSLGFSFRGKWKECDNDASILDIGGRSLVFTTDSFVVDPIFFPGGNIGDLAICGTLNDLAVMGAKPLGISLAMVIEEGFPEKDLLKIMATVRKISADTKVPVVTGDTKVMEKGRVDKIILTTAGIGIADDVLNKKLNIGDKIIISGGLGEHAVALLSKRFDYETEVVSDTKPLIKELLDVGNLIKTAKDATRGGISSVLNEISSRAGLGMLLIEERITAKREVGTLCNMLGIDIYTLASEGVFVCVCSKKNAGEVETRLRKYNKDAIVIGEMTDGDKVAVQTRFGKRIVPKPTGRVVPRIC